MNPSNLKAELDTGWPWPLDSVQGWFEDLWNWVSEAAEAAVKDLRDLLSNWFRGWYWDVFGQLYDINMGIVSDLYDWTKDMPEPVRFIARFFLLPAAVLKFFIFQKLAGIAKEIWDITPDWIKKPISWIEDEFKDIAADLNNFLKDPVGSLKGGWDSIINNISNAVEMGKDMLNTAADDIKSDLKLAFDGAFNAAADTIKTALGGLGDVFKDIKDALSGALDSLKQSWDTGIGDLRDRLDKLMDQYHKDVTEKAPDILKGFGEWLYHNIHEGIKSLVKWLDKDVLEPIWTQVKSLGDWIFQHVKGFYSSIIDELKHVSDSLKAGDIGPMLEFLGTIGALGFGATAITSVMGMKIMGTGIEVGELGSYIKDFINPQTISAIILGVALGAAIQTPAQQYFNKLFRPEIPRGGDLRTYYLRGYINEDKARDFLARQGYADDLIKAEMESWYAIPSISDLIRFVVNEVISLDDYYKYVQMQGLKKQFADWYWRSHWRYPSPGDIREAWWRGIINDEEYRTYIKWFDYWPEKRPGIHVSDQEIMFQLSYNLPERIDTRWLVRWGIITPEEGKKLLKMQGMHPDWIDKVWEAEYLNNLLDERTRVKSEYYSSYTKGYLDRDSLEKKLREVRFIEDEIKYLLDAADESKRRELISITIDYYKELFKRGSIAKTDFIDSLTNLGLDKDYVKRMADTLEAKYVKIDRRDLTKDERNSVRSAALSLYKEGLMTEDQLRQKLSDLGYTDMEIELTIERANLEYQLDYIRDIITEVKYAYRKGVIGDTDFINILVSYGMRRERAETLLEIEQLRKAPKPKPAS